VTRLLQRALGHFEIAANIDQCLRVMRTCRLVLETSAGIHIVHNSLLPEKWTVWD